MTERKARLKIFHQELSTSSLMELHALVRRILVEEDAQPRSQRKYQIREHPDFKEQADAIEDILSGRGESFTPIDWSRLG